LEFLRSFFGGKIFATIRNEKAGPSLTLLWKNISTPVAE
jgi:hypothetical protein